MSLTDAEKMRLDIDIIKESIAKLTEDSLNTERVLINEVNEREFKWLILNETMHYPEYLGEIYNGVWRLLKRYINDGNPNTKNKPINIPYSCKYFDNIYIMLKPYSNQDVSNFSQYKGSFSTISNFKDGKIKHPFITLIYPVNKGSRTVLAYIRNVLCHELTHLYDDWQNRTARKGKYSIDDDNNKNKTGYSEVDEKVRTQLQVLETNIATVLSDILYLSHKTELQSFLSQAVHELESIGCNNINKDNCIYRTSAYTNFSRMKDNYYKTIGKATEEDLREVNDATGIISSDGKTETGILPHIANFNVETFKNKLTNRVETIYHDFMRRYASIVLYYLKDYKGGHTVKHTCEQTDEDYRFMI